MKIAIGSDHAGFRLKEEVAEYLKKQGFSFTDFGTTSTDTVDYPDIAIQVAEGVAAGEFDRGILVCGSGIGMSIAANKVPGIRAALCTDTFCAHSSREHNDSNILALGERVLGIGVALEIVETWLKAEFPGEARHGRRISKMTDIEQKYSTGRR